MSKALSQSPGPNTPFAPNTLSMAQRLLLKGENLALSVLELIPLDSIKAQIETSENIGKIGRGEKVYIELDIEQIYKATDKLGLTQTERARIIQNGLTDWGTKEGFNLEYSPINDFITISVPKNS